MSEDGPINRDFITAKLHRVLSELRILRDDMGVVAATTRRIDNSFERLETGRRTEMREIRDEMREMRAEFCAMHAQQ